MVGYAAPLFGSDMTEHCYDFPIEQGCRTPSERDSAKLSGQAAPFGSGGHQLVSDGDHPQILTRREEVEITREFPKN